LSLEPCSEYFLEKEQLGNGTEDILDPRDWNGLASMAAIHRCRFWVGERQHVADCDEFDL